VGVRSAWRDRYRAGRPAPAAGILSRCRWQGSVRPRCRRARVDPHGPERNAGRGSAEPARTPGGMPVWVVLVSPSGGTGSRSRTPIPHGGEDQGIAHGASFPAEGPRQCRGWRARPGRSPGSGIVLLAAPSHPQWVVAFAAFVPPHSCGAAQACRYLLPFYPPIGGPRQFQLRGRRIRPGERQSQEVATAAADG
jgi:hypothetical protein